MDSAAVVQEPLDYHTEEKSFSNPVENIFHKLLFWETCIWWCENIIKVLKFNYSLSLSILKLFFAQSNFRRINQKLFTWMKPSSHSMLILNRLHVLYRWYLDNEVSWISCSRFKTVCKYECRVIVYQHAHLFVFYWTHKIIYKVL